MDNHVMRAMCDNCPFDEQGAGLQLRLSLSPERWVEILSSLRCGQHFLCHKTTHDGEYEEDAAGVERYVSDGKEKICAGAVLWQTQRGITADFLQIMERLRRRAHTGDTA